MYVWDNTVGSSKRVNQTALAYIAGFLDGDGCIKARIKKKPDNRFGWYLDIVVSFSQHIRNEAVLEWIKAHLRHGTIKDYSNKRLSEYTIYGSEFLTRLLKALKPYVVNKATQLELALHLLSLTKRYKDKREFSKALQLAEKIRSLNNYPKKHSFSSPVTTDLHSI